MVVGCVPHMVRCKCRSLLTWLWDVFLPWSNVSDEPFRHGGRMGLPWLDVSVDPVRHGGRLGLQGLDISVEAYI